MSMWDNSLFTILGPGYFYSKVLPWVVNLPPLRNRRAQFMAAAVIATSSSRFAKALKEFSKIWLKSNANQGTDMIVLLWVERAKRLNENVGAMHYPTCFSVHFTISISITTRKPLSSPTQIEPGSSPPLPRLAT